MLASLPEAQMREGEWNSIFSLPVTLDYFEGEKFQLTQPALWMNFSLTVPPKTRDEDTEGNVFSSP